MATTRVLERRAWQVSLVAGLAIATGAGGQQPTRGPTNDRAGEPVPPGQPTMVPLEGYTPPAKFSGGATPGRATSFPLSVTTWTALGPAPIASGQTAGGMPCSGRLAALAAHPTNANIIYVAAAGGGVWKTADAGTTWTPLTDSQATLVMGAIALAPSDPNTIYAGTGEANNSGDSMYGRGILKSTNGGTSWTLMGNPVFDRLAMSQIAVHPTNPGIVYAATAGAVNGLGGNRGIWKSTDGGVNWVNTTAAITTTLSYTDVVIDPTTPQTVYCAVGTRAGSVTNGVYKSTDGGTTWALAGNFPANDTVNGRIRLAISKTTPQTLYCGITDSGTSGLYKMLKTTDGGTTWNTLGTTPNYQGSQGWYDTTLIVDPTNANIVYAGGGAGTNTIVKSGDGGANWSPIGTGANGNGPHVDHHAIGFDAGGKLLDGNDGGIWRLDNPNVASLQWSSLNGNLNTIQFVGIATDPFNPDVAYGGSQDNGTSRFNNSLAWTLVDGGDGGWVRTDPTTSSTVYHIAPVGSFGTTQWFRRSDDGGSSFSAKVTGLVNSTSALFYAPFYLDPANPNRLFLGTNVANVTSNRADAWSQLPGDTFTFPGGIDLIAVGSADPNTLYASSAGGVYVTTNAGVVWTQRNPAGVTDHFKNVVVDPTNSQVAYIVRDRFNSSPNVGHVFRTANAGVSWTDISSNLPDLPANCIALDANGAGTADDVLYVGTDAQIYQSTNLGASWSVVGSGLPNVRVTDIEVNKNLRILAAGTYGRGLWELSLPRLDMGTVTFSDTTTGNGNGAPDPAETIVLSIPLTNNTATPVANVTATVAGQVANYGIIGPGSTITKTVNFLVPCAATCGMPQTVAIAVNSGLGAQSFSTILTTGVPSGNTVEKFDTVAAPALPANWATSHTDAESNWVTSTTSPSSAPNCAFAPDVSTPGTATLVTPPLFVPAAGTHLAFKLLFNMEDTFDGAVLEISNPAVAAGAFQDIVAAGGSFVTGGYTRPASGRMAWTGLSAGTTTTPAYITPDVILPASAAGQSVQFRFVVFCDAAVIAAGAAGVRVDDFPRTLYTCANPLAALPATQTVSIGAQAQFTVTALGATAYQWRKNTVNIGGATAATFTIPSVTTGDAGTYDCRVTYCGGTSTSTGAVLTIGCYPNCDGSTTPPVVNTGDFTCFLQQYSNAVVLPAAQQQAHYANCDGSTTFPQVNTADFTCFLQKYAAGCS